MDQFENILKKEIVYPINKQIEMNVTKNIIYKSSDTYGVMDLYEPKNNKKEDKRPVVLLIHGEAKGITNMKDAGQYLSWGRLIATTGIKAITFNHRVLSDGYMIKEVIEDITDLVQYVILHANELGIDEEKIVLWSFSGGVPFGMYVGMSNLFNGIKGLVSYYGIGDFKFINEVLNMSMSKGAIDRYSIIKIVNSHSKDIPPVLIVRAGLDDRRLNQLMEEIIMQMFSNNLSVDIINHEQGHHAFDLFDNNDRSHEIIEKSLDYVKRIFKC